MSKTVKKVKDMKIGGKGGKRNTKAFTEFIYRPKPTSESDYTLDSDTLE